MDDTTTAPINGCPLHRCYWRLDTTSRFATSNSLEAHLRAVHGLQSCTRSDARDKPIITAIAKAGRARRAAA
jgi:hypothetical protein